jgi:hypothetical protein
MAPGRGWTLAYTTGVYWTTVVVALPFAEFTSLSWSPDGTRFVVTAKRR